MAERMSSRVHAALSRIGKELESIGARWSLVGGLAVVLLKAASDETIASARDALRLIADRGFARGKDLEAELDHVLERRTK